LLIQSLLLIATMLIVGSALLTSTLVSAKAAFHRAVIQKSETAMSDATAQFVTWAQNHVSKYGTEAAWPTGTQPQSGPISDDLCNGRVTSVPAQTSASSPSSTCPLMATMEWTVTGSSAASTGRGAQTAAISSAQNLSVSLDEQRVSATVTAIITNASGKTVFANHSRELTARIFDATPYVAVTGTRDVSTEVGDIHASEGDTGGYRDAGSGKTSSTQNENSPASLTDTRIITTIDCSNTQSENDQNDPLADGTNVSFDRSVRPFGNLAWAFEAPCAPQYKINVTGAPSDYSAAQGRVYASSAATTESWRKSDENSSAYSQ